MFLTNLEVLLTNFGNAFRQTKKKKICLINQLMIYTGLYITEKSYVILINFEVPKNRALFRVSPLMALIKTYIRTDMEITLCKFGGFLEASGRVLKCLPEERDVPSSGKWSTRHSILYSIPLCFAIRVLEHHVAAAVLYLQGKR